jgi:RNA polymerase sigma-70 factor (ECF subfamily)
MTMNIEKDTDIQLAHALAGGDERALEEFYRRCGEPVYAFIRHHLDDAPQDTEDLWQETLLTALRSIDSYQGRSSLFTWACAIARHKLGDYFRKRRRLGFPISTEQDESAAELIDQAPLPEDWVQSASTRIRVVEALQRLPDDYRTALIARYVDEQEVSQVAVQLGKNYTATQSLLARARGALKALLQPTSRAQEESNEPSESIC